MVTNIKPSEKCPNSKNKISILIPLLTSVHWPLLLKMSELFHKMNIDVLIMDCGKLRSKIFFEIFERNKIKMIRKVRYLRVSLIDHILSSFVKNHIVTI